MNEYNGIVEYYDLWVTSGYYDYCAIAKELFTTIGAGRQVLELGVGTGLLAEQYIALDPTCQFTGFDISASMLELARKRLGEQVTLFKADAASLELEGQFDVAVSNGGAWGVMDFGDHWEFGGHIPGLEANRQGLRRLSQNLRKDGLLFLHLQKPHPTYDKQLDGGIIYSQSTEAVDETPEYRTFRKEYFFKRDGEILAQDEILVTCFEAQVSSQLLDEAGFELVGTTSSDIFAIYKRV